MYSDYNKGKLNQRALEKWRKDKRYRHLISIIRSELDPQLAEIYELRERDQMTFPEIAKMMDLTVAQVIYRHNRAQKILDAGRRRKK